MVKNAGDARSLGDAVLAGLRAEAPAVAADAQALTDSLQVTLAGSEKRFDALAAWKGREAVADLV